MIETVSIHSLRVTLSPATWQDLPRAFNKTVILGNSSIRQIVKQETHSCGVSN